MQSHIDVEGQDVEYGYTKESDGTIWYWEFNGETVEFVDRGLPTDHPYRDTETVPDRIRNHAENYVEKLNRDN